MSDPAFPGIAGQHGHGNRTYQTAPNGDHLAIEHNQGMTLLDYFAGQALAGMLADPGEVGSCSKVAESAYNFGIAMLKEKAKHG
jgi:hypothetical protein